MKDKVLHAIDIKSVLTTATIGLVVGLLLSLVPMSVIVGLMIVLIGIFIIATNGYKIYVRVSNNEKSSNQMLLEVLAVLVGFMLLFLNGTAITIITSVYLIGLPIYYIVVTKGNKDVVTKVLPSIILGVVLLVCGLSTFDILFKIVGIIIILGSLGYLGYNYYLYKKSGVKVIK